jgi:transcriptional regulator with XRE-family HTH domain
MKIENQLTDQAVLEELGRRLTQARLDRNQTQEDFAKAAGLSKRTIERMEAGHSVQMSNLIRAMRALHLTQNIDALLPAAEGPSPLEQLKHKGRERKRASVSKSAPATSGKSEWTWAERS